MSPEVEGTALLASLPAARRTPSRRIGLQVGRLPVVASFVLVFALWELAARQGWINVLFFSSPSDIASTTVKEVQLARFWTDARVSATELVLGYVSGVALAVPAGLALGYFRRLGYFFAPWLSFFYATPRIAYLPMIVLWLGIAMSAKVFVAFLGVFFTLVINVVNGVRTVSPVHMNVGRSFRAGRLMVFRTIIFPGTVPFILAGMRLAVGMGLIGVVVGEFYGSNEGVGHMISAGSHNLQAARVLLGVLVFTLMGALMVAAIRRLERLVETWQPER